MTKSTITRERLEEIRDYDTCVTLEESAELARMALSAMDSEPVIIVGDDGGDALSYRRLIQSFQPGTKLYRHAQPVPVVPDELNTRTANDVMNEHLSWKDYGDAEVFCIAWNACRAAMLAAAPQEAINALIPLVSRNEQEVK